ncbi:hypothetical protein DPMN_045187 [Dreissena polymorpha]|uniref:Uncharacterized protein n=1 Tax=Dreissena polymorpha TaxID=45954 RepID=A0A9D4HX46_DREPO|nr:hypothetical protein DPMN_045187 [Dreissena polymorpha]
MPLIYCTYNRLLFAERCGRLQTGSDARSVLRSHTTEARHHARGGHVRAGTNSGAAGVHRAAHHHGQLLVICG